MPMNMAPHSDTMKIVTVIGALLARGRVVADQSASSKVGHISCSVIRPVSSRQIESEEQDAHADAADQDAQ